MLLEGKKKPDYLGPHSTQVENPADNFLMG